MLWPDKGVRAAKKVGNPWPSGIIFYESALLVTSIAYLWGSTYEKRMYAIIDLCVLFWACVMNCENQKFNWLKFHKIPSFITIINTKGKGIVGGKVVWPDLPCRVPFWPATRQRLATPGLYQHSTTLCSYVLYVRPSSLMRLFSLIWCPKSLEIRKLQVA